MQGKGQYGIVFKGRSLMTHRDVAIKYIMMDGEDPWQLKQVIAEIQILRKLSN